MKKNVLKKIKKHKYIINKEQVQIYTDNLRDKFNRMIDHTQAERFKKELK